MKRILVVDDEPEIRELLADILQSEGYAVTPANDGATALERARSDQPHLVLTDSMMPRLSGPELIRAMREDPHLRDVPIIVMSAAGQPSLDGLDIHTFLQKPFDIDDLISAVESCLTP